MAAYCRVSTNQEEQLLSYENQVNFYTQYINNNSQYEFAGIYADEGLSATNTKKRENFNRMIKDCTDGKIDMIITKSISRFARNTLDCLNYVRQLKELGIGIIFEKENINTLDSKGEVLLTILSSLAQDESRSISENCTWGIRRRFEQGKVIINESKFLGYEKDKEGHLIINHKEAKIVKRIYEEFLDGNGVNQIAKDLERDRIKSFNKNNKWYGSTIESILTNEKYKGDALLQKTYTVDFLSKSREKNEGQVPQYYVEDSHEAIIEKEIWECVQLEFDRRRKYTKEYHIQSFCRNSKNNPLAGKVICGKCGYVYTRKKWVKNKLGDKRLVWQCSTRYKVKGVLGCDNRHIDDDILNKAFVSAYNWLVDNKEDNIKRWESLKEDDDLFIRYKAKQFIDIVNNRGKIREIEATLVNSILYNIVVKEDGNVIVRFVEGTEVECEI